MGFFSKVFKGVKKVFKKVGKGIKSAFKSIGKFMDKIGIVGQIGLSLLLPGIGSALSGMWGSLVGGLQAYSGVGASIINGAGNFLNAATNIASNITKPFTTITEGVKNVVGETLKAGANALGVDTALLKAGETFGSEYLTKLGTSISKANLTSIGNAFTGGVDAFMGSFSGGGVDPAGAFEKARLEATNISPDKIANITPPTPQFADPDLATPDMPASMTEVKVTAKAPDSLLAPDASVTSPSVGDAFDKEFNPDFTAAENQAMRSGDFSAIKKAADPESFIDKTMRLGREKISALPGEAINKLGATITDIPSQLARRAAGLDPDPTYTQVSYATVVPTIEEAPMVSTSMGIDPVQYVASNQRAINMEPFGFNANMYNEATYMNQMRKYGFA